MSGEPRAARPGRRGRHEARDEADGDLANTKHPVMRELAESVMIDEDDDARCCRTCCFIQNRCRRRSS